MAVDAQREPWGMPELLLNVQDRLPGLQEQAGERMAQGVGLSVAEASAAKDGGPDTAERVLLHGAAVRESTPK